MYFKCYAQNKESVFMLFRVGSMIQILPMNYWQSWPELFWPMLMMWEHRMLRRTPCRYEWTWANILSLGILILSLCLVFY